MTVVRVVLSGVLIGLVAGAAPLRAQSPASRITVAPQVTWMNLGDLDATSVGIGGRVTVDLARWIAIDGEVNVFPNDDVPFGVATGNIFSDGLIFQRRRVDGFAGVRAGVRADRFGVFGRVRPGFTHLSDRGVECAGDVCALILIAPPNYQTEFALDFGGTVEFYPSARTVARVDVGDVMIWHQAFAPPCTSCTTHNFSTRVGFGLRF